MIRPWQLGVVGFLVAGCVSLGGPPTEKYRMAYEDANNIVRSPGADALAVQAAYDVVRTCYDGGGGDFNLLRNSYSDKTVETSKGEKTIKQMSLDCNNLLDEVKKKPVEGCGAKQIFFSSDIEGGGKWTKPSWSRPDPDEYIPIKCSDVHSAPAEGDFQALPDTVKQACPDATDVAYPTDWNNTTNQLGVVVHREAIAVCYFKGKRTDWNFYTNSRAHKAY
ncbi:MAG: hypothetical protein U0441_29030 [Polyangiaceae bacterium]